ncbi:MAG: PIG-L family deacetylase [Boseongicola sp.]
MVTSDQSRIAADKAKPRVMELWWALRPLTSVVRFMQSGAHPDDEISGMLAALAFRDGINLSYACSTRGEGGQNDIGTETGADLGALRTREMESACDVLNMRLYWHSESASDAINDFGFSKSGDETLDRWGHERTLARFVEIIRIDRPDILCPTFLDVPGQHGHHRAMTHAAHEVMSAAADRDFASNLPPWQVKKLYLPAWSGAGQSYDDDEPPPPVTLTIKGFGLDPMSGWSWNRIGQQSRAFHRTQGMGRWVSSDDDQDWPLHIAESYVAGTDSSVFSGLARNIGDLAGLPEVQCISDDLKAAQKGILDALAAFPDFAKVANFAIAALEAVGRAIRGCPDAAKNDIHHRLTAKDAQLRRVVRLALGTNGRARTTKNFLALGEETDLTVEIEQGTADAVVADFDLPRGWKESEGKIVIEEIAIPTDSYRSTYDPTEPDAPALLLRINSDGKEIVVRAPFEVEPVVLPAQTVSVSPESAILNLAVPKPIKVDFLDIKPDVAIARLELPDSWRAEPSQEGLFVDAPKDVPQELYRIPVFIDGTQARSVRRIEYSHVRPTARTRAAEIRVRVLSADVPDGRVGYIGAGNDRVGYWLSALGAHVTDLTDSDLASDEEISKFDAIVVGIFAMRFRPALLGAIHRLHRWVDSGGTLVTLYHRPWDNWEPDQVPPRRLEIGQPSLRWRVTDENAKVRHLAEHIIFTTPNQITPEDWAGWVKERGLYFAKSWDSAYIPLLEMSDPGEAPHQGALLVADIGAGRHVHTSLVLHHQMEHLVPGAFRLMANLISKRF